MSSGGSLGTGSITARSIHVLSNGPVGSISSTSHGSEPSENSLLVAPADAVEPSAAWSADDEASSPDEQAASTATTAVAAIDERFQTLTEILRIDIARWLTHTDDPSRSVTMADPESGELIKSSLPRAYDVTILHRLSPTGVNTGWTAARVVLSRKGIRRVDQLDA